MSAHPRPVALVVAPMPAFPMSAGNRRRLVATCDFLNQVGFDLDFAYVGHEDQIYRRFGRQPPTDFTAMENYFRRVYFIEQTQPVRLRTGAKAFALDDWLPEELGAFVERYFAHTPEARVILVNYVFLSGCLRRIPGDVLSLLDTHDRFAGRKDQYLSFRGQANFYHTDAACEAEGLARAHIPIAIQPLEQIAFAHLTQRPVALLMPQIEPCGSFVPRGALRAIGFMGHGNDANLISIGRFNSVWSRLWRPGAPILRIAGEICGALSDNPGQGIEKMGYVEKIEDFFDQVDLVVAPILMGTGLKLKIIEALAHGVPVVGTRLAFEGFETQAPDHNFTDLDALAARIFALAENARELELTQNDSARLFDAYRARAQMAAIDLKNQLLSYAPAPACASPNLTRPHQSIETRLWRNARLTELFQSPQPRSAIAEGLIFATEFLPVASDLTQQAYETAISPLRRIWTVAPAQQDFVSWERSPLKGLTVSLGPLLAPEAPLSDQTRPLAEAAASALAAAAPDWDGRAASFQRNAEFFTAVFRGPAFLLRAPARVFLIDRHDEAHVVEQLAFAQNFAPVAGEARAGARCADAAFLDLRVSMSTLSDLPVSMLIVANGLWGLVRLRADSNRTELD